MEIKVREDNSSSTSHSLLVRVQRQDPQAWQRFATLYGPLVFRWCRSKGLQPDDAGDVIQEVFQGVFQGIGRFERNKPGQSLRGWLWTITRNKISDHFRRQLQQPIATVDVAEIFDLAQLPDSPAEPAETIAAEIAHRALGLIQTDFEPKTWRAFWALAVEGLSTAETAAQLNLSSAAVYKAKSRVLARLRLELDGLLD